ncbi:hypothetical protein Tdes44962_MAKER00483 [Teratosphaeria destructans]|uniref:Uncharacterized protein n=1 Tax=Teratosphaeria destructans TaxID=418781 RepID=A0A9W7SPU3_9PEZI|nr:hypothetical protein Tdes44962_MAKER00483 [Teratosphaeria destructans]
MGSAAWAIPVGVLAGLCGLMFVFIWWWFPRHYRKGVRADMVRVDEERRRRQLAEAEMGDIEGGAAPSYQETVPQKPTFVYTPQAYTSY